MKQIKNTQILVKNSKILYWKYGIDQKYTNFSEESKNIEWKYEIDQKYTNFSEK